MELGACEEDLSTELEPADMLDSEYPTDSEENSDGPLVLVEGSS